MAYYLQASQLCCSLKQHKWSDLRFKGPDLTTGVQALPYLVLFEVQRKDFWENVCHHLATLGLITYSYQVKYVSASAPVFQSLHSLSWKHRPRQLWPAVCSVLCMAHECMLRCAVRHLLTAGACEPAGMGNEMTGRAAFIFYV